MIGSTIIHLDIVDSTNNYAAKESLTKSLNEGTVFVATCQQSGRGQGQSSWESEKGLNLTFSFVLYPKQVEVIRQFTISMAISLGVVDFLNQFTSQVSIKWPNDIYVEDKKIAGILIETSISSGKISRAIIGIGLNINQEKFVSDAPNPVSLRNLTSKVYDLNQMLGVLCKSLEQRYFQLISDKDSRINDDYERHLYQKGEWSDYRSDNVEFEGKIKGVDPDGRLLIETRKGEVRCFDFKEVAFLQK